MNDTFRGQTGDPISRMRDAIDAVTRYAVRGCSSISCDRARIAWLSNQLGIIGHAAIEVTAESRRLHPDIPWESLCRLADEMQGLASMTADEMQQYAENELPRVRQLLKQRQ